VIFVETLLKGAYRIEPELKEDERGFFTRTFCQREFAERGLNPNIAQCSVSYNRHAGTLRGLHYQLPPYAEAKLVRCTAGAVIDVIVDLRAGSPTFMQWTAVELSAANRAMLYVPEGFAHGFQTLVDHTEVLYQISEFYEPASARGIRWDDPVLNIPWPNAERIISPRDLAFPLAVEAELP
jgi:dTDP-4-dehydrorhamnose 3,5-epimerase